MGLLSSGIAGIRAGNTRTEKAMGNYFPPKAPVRNPVQAQAVRANTSDIYGRSSGYQANANFANAARDVNFYANPKIKAYPSDMRQALNTGAQQGFTYQGYQPMGNLVNRYLDRMAPQRMGAANGY